MRHPLLEREKKFLFYFFLRFYTKEGKVSCRWWHWFPRVELRSISDRSIQEERKYKRKQRRDEHWIASISDQPARVKCSYLRVDIGNKPIIILVTRWQVTHVPVFLWHLFTEKPNMFRSKIVKKVNDIKRPNWNHHGRFSTVGLDLFVSRYPATDGRW